ncbi:MAG: polysaccharide deacetylase family protein [Defluviitaleaceae bacterium]|nr:polysaccharide deacetylase family protein [Defluviitaleaceae bacterium]
MKFKRIKVSLLSLIMLVGLVTVSIPMTTAVEGSASPQYGHVRGAAYISAADITMLRRYLASSDSNGFMVQNPNFNRDNADVDGNGVIDAADVERLREYLAATDPSTVTLGPRTELISGRRYPQLSDFPSGTRFIALTFDDGPNTEYTVQILNELSRLGAKATFYVNPVRFSEDTLPVVRRMIEEGHDVCNHGWDHTSFGNDLTTGRHTTRQAARDDVLRTSQAIFDATGYWPWSFRAPFFEWGGQSNLLLGLDRELNMAFIDSGMDTNDWMDTRTSRDIANTILNNPNPRGGIVLMHDCGGSRQRTVDALEMFIPQMQARGYEFVTVRELFLLQDVMPELFQGVNAWPRVNQWVPTRRGQWEPPIPLWPNNPDWWNRDWWTNSTPPWERNIQH